MSKAFDRVRHDALLDKLQNINYRGNLHSWSFSYLSGRKQCVTVPGVSSLAVTSGVPQGSILGPLLFLLYVNDIHDTVTTSSVSCFADDTKLFKTINNQMDTNLLQNYLHHLSRWSTSSGLNYNKLKTNCQTITQKRSPLIHKYTVNGKPIGRLNEECDLGVRVTNTLSWKSQVVSETSAANKSLGCVCRSVNDITVCHTLYLGIARPHLGYANSGLVPNIN
jgi:hypothetical protein